MENNQNMVTEKLLVSEVQSRMENNRIILMEKLGVLGILKEAIKIPYKCPKFILLTFLTSLPLIVAMVLHEIILQASMVETKSFLNNPPADESDGSGFIRIHVYGSRQSFYSYNTEVETMLMLLQNMSPRLFQLGFLYLAPLHLFDLINTIITVNSASATYADEPMRLREMLLIPVKESRFTGPLITSLCVLFLNCFVLFGLVWAVTNSILPFFGFFTVIYRVGSIVLTVKWIEWTAVWNMSIVFSALGERHGVNALGASEYFSRGNRKRGLQLMLLFFVWRIVLRVSFLYVGGGHEKWTVLVATSFLSCVGNVMKWVVCTVYFYDCKKRVLEKKVDGEEGGAVKKLNTGAAECNDV